MALYAFGRVVDKVESILPNNFQKLRSTSFSIVQNMQTRIVMSFITFTTFSAVVVIFMRTLYEERINNTQIS